MVITCHSERLYDLIEISGLNVKTTFMNTTPKKPSLLDKMRSHLRREGYAYSTENSYCDWVKRFVKYHGVADRDTMLIESAYKVEQFFD